MDLTTRYLGLQLRNPLLAGASPLSHTVDGVRSLADAGVGAVVVHSLFEEEIRREAEQKARFAMEYNETYAESLTYFPATVNSDHGAKRYLHLIESAASSVDIPVIGSATASPPADWRDMRGRSRTRARRPSN